MYMCPFQSRKRLWSLPLEWVSRIAAVVKETLNIHKLKTFVVKTKLFYYSLANFLENFFLLHSECVSRIDVLII